MSEFANRIRTQATETLRRMSGQAVTPEADPILELIGCLLEDGAGGVLNLPDSSVSTPQWLTWSRLALEHEQHLSDTITQLLEQERTELPEESAALRQWAANLLLAALDRWMIA